MASSVSPSSSSLSDSFHSTEEEYASELPGAVDRPMTLEATIAAEIAAKNVAEFTKTQKGNEMLIFNGKNINAQPFESSYFGQNLYSVI